LQSPIKNLFNNLINCGVTPELKIEEAQIVRLTNLFGIFPMLFFMVYIANGIIYDISFFWQIGLINALLNIIAIWCNYKAYYPAAKTILLASNSLILLLFANVVAGNASAVAFFFPVLTCYVVFYDIMKEWKTVIVNLAVTAGCIISCLMLPEHFFGKVPLPAYMSGNITRLNFMLAFCAFTFYVYLIIKVKLQTETLLIQSRETAEIMADKSEQMVSQLTVQKDKAEHASRSKSYFLSNMSQELRTPLNNIIATSNALAEQFKKETVGEQLHEMKYSGEHMLSLINDILDFNKMESGKLKLEKHVFNLKALTDKIGLVFRHQFSGKPVAFNVEFDERLNKDVVGDEARLNRVLSNLVSNALKFTHGGSITLRLTHESETEESMKVHFSITNTGSAIAENQAPTGLQRFIASDTTSGSQYNGTGMALALSQKIVQLYGGKLIAETEEGKGSRFHFSISLNISQQKKRLAPEEKKQELHALNGINVLLVEDNKINMLVARRFLLSWQVNIKEAINGQEGVDLFKTNAFDLIILDLEMPVMDGYQAIAEIRKLDPAIPVIAFTASVFDNMKTTLLAAGFNDFISKPFRPEELHQKIASYAVRA
jgi:signal transduction histidine kinase/CheY-like chemotaxis protein